jgi:hypothetical protein
LAKASLLVAVLLVARSRVALLRRLCAVVLGWAWLVLARPHLARSLLHLGVLPLPPLPPPLVRPLRLRMPRPTLARPPCLLLPCQAQLMPQLPTWAGLATPSLSPLVSFLGSSALAWAPCRPILPTLWAPMLAWQPTCLMARLVWRSLASPGLVATLTTPTLLLGR